MRYGLGGVLLGCHRCDLACPNEVNVSELIARAKHAQEDSDRKMRDWWFARPGLLGKLLTIAPGVGNFALGLKPVRLLMSTFMKITPERTFPAYSKSTLNTPEAATAKQGERVVFFPAASLNTPAGTGLPRFAVVAIERVQARGCSQRMLRSAVAGERRSRGSAQARRGQRAEHD